MEGIILDGYTPIQEVVDMLNRMDAKGYRLGMISNTTCDGAKRWQELEFFKLFRGYVNFSFTSPGVRKPEGLAHFIQGMALEMGLRVHQLLYADDKFDNVKATVDAGIGGGVHIISGADAGIMQGQITHPKIVTATTQTLEPTLKQVYGLVF